MAHLIPASAVDRYQAAPPRDTMEAVKCVFTSIRKTLGSSYGTFLQGSFSNGTAISNLEEIDIVAIRRNAPSTVFGGQTTVYPIPWETIFNEVQYQLEASRHYQGATTKDDKFIKVATGLSADVVPAREIAGTDSDPVSIYSKREGRERKHFPRIHHENVLAKDAATQQRFKPAVRMFKYWARSHFPDDAYVAPSFYLECLIYNFADAAFLANPAERFAHIASTIAALNYSRRKIVSVAQDKDVLTDSEWPAAQFQKLQFRLANSVECVKQAIGSWTTSGALQSWRRAFNE